MKLIIMILFTLMMVLPALADETPPASEKPAATGQTDQSPPAAYPCTDDRTPEGGTTGTNGANGGNGKPAVAPTN